MNIENRAEYFANNNFEMHDNHFKGLKKGYEEGYRDASKDIFKFIDWLLSIPVTRYQGISTEPEEYMPKEFNLLRGDLIKNGEELLKQFRYEN